MGDENHVLLMQRALSYRTSVENGADTSTIDSEDCHILLDSAAENTSRLNSVISRWCMNSLTSAIMLFAKAASHQVIAEAILVVFEVDAVAAHRHKVDGLRAIMHRTRRVNRQRNNRKQASERMHHREAQQGMTESCRENRREGRIFDTLPTCRAPSRDLRYRLVYERVG